MNAPNLSIGALRYKIEKLVGAGSKAQCTQIYWADNYAEAVARMTLAMLAREANSIGTTIWRASDADGNIVAEVKL